MKMILQSISLLLMFSLVLITLTHSHRQLQHQHQHQQQQYYKLDAKDAYKHQYYQYKRQQPPINNGRKQIDEEIDDNSNYQYYYDYAYRNDQFSYAYTLRPVNSYSYSQSYLYSYSSLYYYSIIYEEIYDNDNKNGDDDNVDNDYNYEGLTMKFFVAGIAAIAFIYFYRTYYVDEKKIVATYEMVKINDVDDSNLDDDNVNGFNENLTKNYNKNIKDIKYIPVITNEES